MTIFDKTSTESLEHSNAGAGLGIQPIGLRVLQRLNVLDDVLTYGSRIDQLKAVDVSWKDRTVLDLSYSDFQESLFGVGLHRSVLFHSLRRLVENESNIKIRCGVEVTNVNIPETLSADPNRANETLVVRSQASSNIITRTRTRTLYRYLMTTRNYHSILSSLRTADDRYVQIFRLISRVSNIGINLAVSGLFFQIRKVSLVQDPSCFKDSREHRKCWVSFRVEERIRIPHHHQKPIS